ncbi:MULTISPECIES: MgtC/SapB family protein [unclassified Polynucleobacter]|uniref:MgtC/SapB family protein n=1 Tax=unclassified Polynucleobacter TaxID=2640945 RepID=UPI0024906A3E|nr:MULTISPECIES: MgtC/SapB family protein [unclassified Polynucleobacter]
MEFINQYNLGSLEDTTVSLLTAFILGGIIGLERQFRQRTAGLRTNVLVALGASIFVDIANRIHGHEGAVHVMAYVVSGIGFLGAGVMMREEGNIRGLNTAATLWGSAAVGAASGADLIFEAMVGTVFILMANTLLRPVVNSINKRPIDLSKSEVTATINIVAEKTYQKLIMSNLLKLLNEIQYPIDDLDITTFGSNDIEIEAKMISTSMDNHLLDHVVEEMLKSEHVRQAFWTPSTTE